MDSETHFSIVFNIYGGSNQILPNATSATQNYYGDEAELEKDDVSMDKEPALSPEAMRLFSYINKVEDLRIYLVQIAECTNAVELARVIVKMGEREPKITSEEMVKERFISLFFLVSFPFRIGHKPLRGSGHRCVQESQHGYGSTYDIEYTEIGCSQ